MIENALAERYCAPEWAFLLQVRSSTGANYARTADALAMSLYPSRGLHLHGFEIKVSKSDWKRELSNPDKAEEIARFCHFWWVVAPEGVVPVDEVPPNWGLLELIKDGRWKIAKKAEFLKAEPLTHTLLAGVFRNISTRMVTASSVQDRINAAITTERESRSDRLSRQVEHLQEDLKVYREFEKTAGIRVRSWDMGNIARIVEMLRYSRDDPSYYRRQLERVRDEIAALGENLETALNGIDTINAQIAEVQQ